MVETFIQHIERKSLLSTSKTYLLACSGGLDSMCLANMLLAAEIPFELAHVNFQLRGKESDEDEQFVRQWASTHHKVCHVLQTDTYGYAASQNISTQMAAREIRYNWFDQVSTEQQLAGVITAHHLDDQIETIFLNLLRSTGIEGIYGMAEKRGHLIRPLLPFSREEIAGYAMDSHIQWREDSSNEKTDYKRNKLRHLVLPALYEVADDAKNNLCTSFGRLKDTGRAFSSLFEQWKAEKVKEEDGLHYLAIDEIKRTAGAASLLYFWLKQYGFNSDQAQDILHASATSEPGKLFESGSHLLNLDRNKLILAPKSVEFDPMEIREDDIEINLPEGKFDILKIEGKEVLDKSRQNAMLDLELLTFPLLVRTWKEGDRFVPLGMKHSKKISDFLIDLKVPILKKNGVKVLLSEEEIAWVIGYRIADWAKATPATRKLLYLKKNQPNA